MENKFYLSAPIKIHKETAALREKASKVIKLPADHQKQPDLMYFSAILVSSGENLNHAYFMPSELVAAEGTIVNKALDVEHEEEEIIGHMYDKAFIDVDGNTLDFNELASTDKAALDSKSMHIVMAGVIYKARFPNIAAEVASGEWDSVSMECYYENFDVKIGDLVVNRREAEMLGLASIDKVLGKKAKVVRAGKEVASGAITRVLRNICFSGCGIVKSPANPASLILETASEDNIGIVKNSTEETIILDYDVLDNNVTLNNVEESCKKEEAVDGLLDDTIGVCVNYKKSVEDVDGNITKENWCMAYDKACTSFSRDTTDPDCLRNKDILEIATKCLNKLLKERAKKDKRRQLLEGLRAALSEAVKTRSQK